MIKPKDMTDEELRAAADEQRMRHAVKYDAQQRERKLKREMAYAALDDKTMAKLADIFTRAVFSHPGSADQARQAFPELQDLFSEYFEDRDNIW